MAKEEGQYMTDKETVGIVGGGLIGKSWASLFLAWGHEVVLYEPRPEGAAELEAFVAEAWEALRALGEAKSETPPPTRATTDLADLGQASFVQECGPDRIEIKQKTVAALEEVLGEQVVIASSTSSLMASDIQRHASHPGRILVAHPMNPPHLVPMVELVPGKLTDEASMERAEAFYRAIERVTIRVKKEMMGHLANRLTSALYREAVYAVQEGIASVEDVDRAIAYGPGMRWALMGPHLIYHLGGGPGGYRHYLDHLGPTQEARWKEHGTPHLSEETKEALVQGLEQELESQDRATLVQRRDAALVELLRLKHRYGL